MRSCDDQGAMLIQSMTKSTIQLGAKKRRRNRTNTWQALNPFVTSNLWFKKSGVLENGRRQIEKAQMYHEI